MYIPEQLWKLLCDLSLGHSATRGGELMSDSSDGCHPMSFSVIRGSRFSLDSQQDLSSLSYRYSRDLRVGLKASLIDHIRP